MSINKYAIYYDRIISRAKNRVLPSDVYCEKHHILPKCMGGTNDKSNIVELTPEEHYVCHQLLIKIYPNNRRLVYAANMMTIGSNRKNNKRYGWLRRMFAKPIPTKQELHILYIKEKLGIQTIAKKFQVDYRTARKWLLNYKIKLRQKSLKKKPASIKELLFLYIDQQKSTITIGKKFGVDKSTIAKWLVDYGISLRKSGGHHGRGGRRNQTKDNNID